MYKVILLNGPNLNLLGYREPKLYGETMFDDLIKRLTEYSRSKGIDLISFQSNNEGELIDQLHIDLDASGVIINPGGLSHTSVALLDALKLHSGYKIEVHVTNVHSREPFRQRLITAQGVDGVISGLGVNGYFLAIDQLLHKLKEAADEFKD